MDKKAPVTSTETTLDNKHQVAIVVISALVGFAASKLTERSYVKGLTAFRARRATSSE